MKIVKLSNNRCLSDPLHKVTLCLEVDIRRRIPPDLNDVTLYRLKLLVQLTGWATIETFFSLRNSQPRFDSI